MNEAQGKFVDVIRLSTNETRFAKPLRSLLHLVRVTTAKV